MTALPPTWPLPTGAADEQLTFDQLQINLRRAAGEYWLESGWLGAASDLVGVQQHRFLTGATDVPITAQPRLADRAVVSRPQVPAVLLPRERVTLLVSTVLWVELRLDDRVLLELPGVRLSDTWFGPHTREGELCYASQTRARTQRLDVENPWRAITPVTIINRGDDGLKLDRINVPVPNLALYGDSNQLWTSALTIGREGANAPAKVQIESGPPSLSPQAGLLASPRRPVRNGVFDRALNLMFA